MANTFKFGNGEWAVGKETALAYNDENSNFKPLPFTFDRASTATVVNKQGLIETVGIDEPRIDFLNNTKGHLLLEPSRQNLVTYSEDLTEWTTTSLSVTSNNVLSPDGTQNADKVTATANFARIQYTYTLSASTTYNISFYVKNIDAVNPRVQVYDNDNSTSLLNTYYGSELTGEWKRLTYSFTTTTGTSILVRPIRDINDTEEMYLWGIQVEAGSYATSYIPTQGSAVTRSAEKNSISNISQLLSSSGVIYAEIKLGASTANSLSSNIRFGLSEGESANNWVFFGIESGDKLRTYVRASSSTSTDATTNGVFPSPGIYKVAFRFDLNNTKVFVNGVQKFSDTSSIPPSTSTLSSYQTGGTGIAASNIDEIVEIKETKLYNTALTDAELIQLTS